MREPTECPGPGQSAYTLGYNDFHRAQAQQQVINGIKDRLTDPLRLPYNFVKGPIIGWDAPKAFVSDMGFLTMPQLVLSAAIGGSAPTDVLCAGAHSGCEIRPRRQRRSPRRHPPPRRQPPAQRLETSRRRADTSRHLDVRRVRGQSLGFGRGLGLDRRRTWSRSTWSRPDSRLPLFDSPEPSEEPPLAAAPFFFLP